MSNRLLTLLTDIERSIAANDPSPDGGAWDTLRLINFHQGLARLTLSARSSSGAMTPKGVILLQHFTLADDTQCVKANLSWHGVTQNAVYSIYSKPSLNWNLESSQIATQWLDGLLAAAEAHTAEAHPVGVADSANPMMSAVG